MEDVSETRTPLQPDPRDVRIAELEKKIADLERIIEEWKRGHRARSKRRSTRQASAVRKKPGRKKGHAGAQRKGPGKVDRREEFWLKCCEACTGGLKATGNSSEQKIEEVIPAKVEVVGLMTYEYECRSCGKLQWSKLPPKYGPAPLLGPSVLAMIVSLRYELRLSFHQVAWHMTKVVGLRITASGVYQMLARAARRTAPVTAEILETAGVHRSTTWTRQATSKMGSITGPGSWVRRSTRSSTSIGVAATASSKNFCACSTTRGRCSCPTTAPCCLTSWARTPRASGCFTSTAGRI